MNNENFINKQRNIDIVFCIDGTGSMRPCIQRVKDHAKRFYSDFAKAITAEGSDIDMLRLKIITFRDYKIDAQESMVESPFFELPEEEDAFAGYLDAISAHGGCGEDACGLEALYFAMKSDFVTGRNDRQVIVLFSDTSSIPLKKRAEYAGYPADMVDEDGLLETWMCMQSHSSRLREHNKRLVLFAPESSSYHKMAEQYNRCLFEAVAMNRGMQDLSFDDILRVIVASASNA